MLRHPNADARSSSPASRWALLALPSLAFAFLLPLAVVVIAAVRGRRGQTTGNTRSGRRRSSGASRQESISRVSSYDWFGSLLFNPLGLALAGPIAAAIGTSETLAIAGCWFVGLVARARRATVRPRRPRRASLRAMRVLVTGGAGFIGSHFVRRLAAAGDEVVVLDKLTYAGNRANLDGRRARVPPGRHRRSRGGRDGRRGLRGDRQLRRRVARRPLDPRPGRVHPHRRPRDAGAARPRAPRRASGSCRSRPTRSTATSPPGALPCTEDAPLRPSSPYSASKTGGDLQVLAYVRTYGVDALHHPRRQQLRPAPVPGEADPALHHERVRGQASCPVYGDGRQRREWLHADDYSSAIELVMREAPPGEIYNVGGQERENMEVVRRILDLTGASPDLVRHVEDRPGHDRRYAVDSVEGARRSAGRRRTPSRTAGSRRRWPGTARTAPGGSRSSRASTARTTSSSTASASRLKRQRDPSADLVP